MDITRLASDCPDGRTCHNVDAVDGDDQWVYITGDQVTDPALLAEIPRAPHENTIRFPRAMWENRSA